LREAIALAIFPTLLARADINSLGIVHADGDITGFVSGFSVTEFSEPSSLALLGLGGLLVARRRRS
jgi:hypothetical protein